MTKTLSKIVVVDLECSCWENANGTKTPPPNELTEIIEIGACYLHTDSGKITHRTSYIIKPRHSKISEFCFNLTKLSQEDVNKGMPFGDAVNKLKKEFGVKNKIWASWGDGDRTRFYKNCQMYGVEYPFGERHINISTLFSLIHQLEEEIGVSAALKYCGLDFSGQPHRGADDAFNEAKLLWRCLR